MTIDERSRHELYDRLATTLGAEAASTLMEHLPPVGWADVATKRDLDAQSVLLRQEIGSQTMLLRQEMATMEQRIIAQLRGELNGQTRTIMLGMVGTLTSGMLGAGGLAFAAARFV